MCAFKAYINIYFWKKKLKIKKVITDFSIPDKIFQKIENLICIIKAHINQTLHNNIYKVSDKKIK